MPPKTKKISKNRELLRSELDRSILIDPEERAFWLSNLMTMPMPIVKNLLKTLADRNAVVDSYIETALAQDTNQEHLKALRQKVARIRKTAFQIEEKGTANSEKQQEEDLLKQLYDIDQK